MVLHTFWLYMGVGWKELQGLRSGLVNPTLGSGLEAD